MSQVRHCTRCGHEGHDVESALVDLEAEAMRDGSSIGLVEVVREIEHRHVTERYRLEVPERYSSVPRCRDREACRTRRRALEPMPAAPAPGPDEEEADLSWLL